MPSSRANESAPSGWELEDLQRLSALGFGPNSALMNEPKLLIDSPFLTALQREFFDELGDDTNDFGIHFFWVKVSRNFSAAFFFTTIFVSKSKPGENPKVSWEGRA